MCEAVSLTASASAAAAVTTSFFGGAALGDGNLGIAGWMAIGAFVLPGADGTAGTAKRPQVNLVEEYTQATVQQLGFSDAQAVLAFYQRHPAEEPPVVRHVRGAERLVRQPGRESRA